jgi:hypothetical protein
MQRSPVSFSTAFRSSATRKSGDERISGLRARIDEVEQPITVFGKFEIVILLLDLDDLAPLGAEFAIGAAFFFGEELLLTHAVIAALSGFVKVTLVPEAL